MPDLPDLPDLPVVPNPTNLPDFDGQRIFEQEGVQPLLNPRMPDHQKEQMLAMAAAAGHLKRHILVATSGTTAASGS